MTIALAKTESLYAAYSPEFGVIAYGGCQDEAINNLADDIRQRKGPKDHSPKPR